LTTTTTSRLLSFSRSNGSIVKITDEIVDAIQSNRPVVALESTIITHGMPYPINLECAKNVEQIARNKGAIPATIAVIDGQICVGLTDEQIRYLAKESSITGRLLKISRSDLPYAVARRASGGTTVSATSLVANGCGIGVFATGGIGGVHRDVVNSWDISADLTELGRTPITVVCAGVKSILDIPKTLEFLETQGVCVIVLNGDRRVEDKSDGGGGNKWEFPAFFQRTSGSSVGYNVENSGEVAKIIASRNQLGLQSAIVVAVPIPHDYQAIGQQIDAAIGKALVEINDNNISGKSVTPYLLSRVNQLTDGQSLSANLGLIRHNVEIGAEIAIEFSKLLTNSDNREPLIEFTEMMKSTEIINQKNLNRCLTSEVSNQSADEEKKEMTMKKKMMEKKKSTPVVIGGSIYDIVSDANTKSLRLDGSTYSGNIRTTLGGVGRNIFDCLSKLGLNPIFISSVGNDSNGKAILRCNDLKNPNGIEISDEIPTSSCTVIVDGNGECRLVVGDLRCHQLITKQHISQFVDDIKIAPLVIIDANIPIESMAYVLDVCSKYTVPERLIVQKLLVNIIN
ncbi:pseudouridine-5'-phosphate glycosidase-like, partial [Oppia nitens]|uniref:pseudouridine-5'-phosphate glycosidase-like n=1 Tax=Oppia nitens TaxID=1686743 RepID=UPI0023DBE928